MGTKSIWCSTYVGLWIIYQLQGVFYSPGIVNQLIQLTMLLWALSVFVREFSIFGRSSICKSAMILMVMYSIYGMHNIMFGRQVSFSLNGALMTYVYLQNSLNSLLPIFLFYYYTKIGVLNERRIKAYFLVFIIIAVINYYKYQIGMQGNLDREEVTNNIGYWFAYLIPFVFFFQKKSMLQFVFISLLMFYVVMGMKRGAILIGLVGMMAFIYYGVKNSSQKQRSRVIALTLFVSVLAYFFVQHLVVSSPYFAYRVEQTLDGNSSERNVIYSSIWRAIISETNIMKILFGHGANQTIAVAGNYAHNDWLETIYNNGILGLAVLLSFYITFAKSVLRSKKRIVTNMFASFLIVFLSSFMASIFSMSIQSLLLFQSMLIGYFAYIESTNHSVICASL